MSKNTASEASGVDTAAAIESTDAAGTGATPTKVRRKVVAAKQAKARNAAKTARALDKEGAIDPKDGRRRPKTRANAASKSVGSTRKGSRTAAGSRTPKDEAERWRKAGKKARENLPGAAPRSTRATRKADAKGGEARKRPGPAPRPLKAGEPPTPMAKPLGQGKGLANAGPAVEAALATFDGSRALLAKFLGIQSQNLGRILRSHRAGWAEKIPDQFVARLSAVSGIAPAEINPFVFLPSWKVPKMSKKEAMAYATGEKPLPWSETMS